jgi:hypothetical protein
MISSKMIRMDAAASRAGVRENSACNPDTSHGVAVQDERVRQDG